MISKIFKIVVSILFMLYFSACSIITLPKPMNVHVKNINNIPNIDKIDLLKISIEKVYRKDRGGFALRDNTISQKNSYHLSDSYYKKYYIYDYLLDKTYTKLYMKDRSYSIRNGEISKVEDGSNIIYYLNGAIIQSYIDGFQVRLLQQYELDILLYANFKEKYHKAKLEFDKKYQQIHIATKDTTNIVPSKIIKELSKYQLWSNEDTVINSYRKGNNLSFKIGSRVLRDQEGRYKVNYEKYKYMEEYTLLPTKLVYEINEVYYNYLPKTFIAKDKNINLEVVNNTEFTDGDSMNSLKITNNTKEFIEINTMAAYYNQDVIDNILNIASIKLAPMSYKIIKKSMLKDFPSSKLVRVTNKNQKNNYGFSIGYKMINQNIMKNLYKVNAYTINN